jgi:hypothetical protein
VRSVGRFPPTDPYSEWLLLEYFMRFTRPCLRFVALFQMLFVLCLSANYVRVFGPERGQVFQGETYRDSMTGKFMVRFVGPPEKIEISDPNQNPYAPPREAQILTAQIPDEYQFAFSLPQPDLESRASFVEEGREPVEIHARILHVEIWLSRMPDSQLRSRRPRPALPLFLSISGLLRGDSGRPHRRIELSQIQPTPGVRYLAAPNCFQRLAEYAANLSLGQPQSE